MPKWALTILAAAVIFTMGAASGARLADNHWQKKWDAHVKADKKAIDAAVAKARADERRSAQLTQTSGETQVRVQTKIVDHTVTLIKEVPKYVTVQQDARSCVSYGLVRLLDAASSGRDPADLELPAGQSNDACAPVEASALAASVVENYGIARQNAAQLDGLIADTRARLTIANDGIVPF